MKKHLTKYYAQAFVVYVVVMLALITLYHYFVNDKNKELLALYQSTNDSKSIFILMGVCMLSYGLMAKFAQVITVKLVRKPVTADSDKSE